MSIIKSFISKIIVSSGYNIYKKGIMLNNPTEMSGGLTRMKLLGVDPDTIVDVGAACGTWTEKAIVFWPDAQYKLIEPLMEQTEALDRLQSKYPSLNYHLAAAGEEEGEAWLNVSSDLDGSGIYGKHKNARKVPMMTIDEIVKNTTGSLMIKLDTHGYELQILNGAKAALQRTQLLVIEVYGFYVSPTAPLFHELSTFLYSSGFRLIDIVDVVRRPGDNAFWQADAFYLKKDHPVFKRNYYV
jgi:FkbM family methyltransferase